MLDIDMPLTEDWLKENGFKWHQFDRQPDKHWLLWVGDAMDDRVTSYEDLGIEVAPGRRDGGWFCWLRSDAAGRYHRFIHLRQLQSPRDLIEVISGITGISFDPKLCFGGILYSPDRMERLLKSRERFDTKLIEGHPWYGEFEKDQYRGRPLIEHVQAYEEARVSRSNNGDSQCD